MTSLGTCDLGYNDRNELTSGARHTAYMGERTTERRQYGYDPIGNRAQSTWGTSAPLYYCTNPLNQYAATDNAAGCAPPVTESYSYDADGNLTQDGASNYAWDAENRLLSVVPRTLSAGKKKMEFRYDHQGRRVEKKVSNWNGSVWTVDSLQRFVYDGWNVVLVISGSTTTKYTWGLDLSGTLQGAGASAGCWASGTPTPTATGTSTTATATWCRSWARSPTSRSRITSTTRTATWCTRPPGRR